MKLSTLPHTIYRLLNKFVPCDITQVLLLELEACQRPSSDVSAYDFRFLSATDVRRLSDSVSGDQLRQMADVIEQGEARCFAALDQNQIAAYAWFTCDHVATKHNTGGTSFSGIGLKLPEDMVYLFKAFVLPKYRGQSLNNWIFHYAGEVFSCDGIKRIVTTTDWTNKAFQKSAYRGGFVKRGHAAEWIIAGKHFYHLPELGIPGLNFFRATD
jgi:hypothetical protein